MGDGLKSTTNYSLQQYMVSSWRQYLIYTFVVAGAQRPLLACLPGKTSQQNNRYVGSPAGRSVWLEWGFMVGAQTIQTLFAVLDFTLLPLLGTRLSPFNTSYIFCHSAPVALVQSHFLGQIYSQEATFFSCLYVQMCLLFQIFYLLNHFFFLSSSHISIPFRLFLFEK